MVNKKGGKEAKGKKEVKKHPTIKKGDYFKVEGEAVKRERKHCPKCGPGTLMAKHSDRENCGNCGFTEYKKK